MLIKLALLFVSGIAILLVGLGVWRWTDLRADSDAWQQLARFQVEDPEVFNLEMIEGLPEPAQRFFTFSIRPGTKLHRVVEITMEGDFSLGTKADPNYMPMSARQIIAAPHGSVWQVTAGQVPMRMSGSDGTNQGDSWSRFWLLELIPVLRVGGDRDHARSALGRFVSEALFWSPAALLPSENVRWEAVDSNTARVIVQQDGFEQSVDVTVAENGAPQTIVFPRWSNANPTQQYQLQPFGGHLFNFKLVDGFMLPMRVEAGNFFGTKAYFPFYKATITDIRFPAAK